MSTTNTRLLFQRRKKIEEKADEYERKVALYLAKWRAARKKLRYYDARIQKAIELKQPKASETKRVIEV